MTGIHQVYSIPPENNKWHIWKLKIDDNTIMQIGQACNYSHISMKDWIMEAVQMRLNHNLTSAIYSQRRSRKLRGIENNGKA